MAGVRREGTGARPSATPMAQPSPGPLGYPKPAQVRRSARATFDFNSHDTARPVHTSWLMILDLGSTAIPPPRNGVSVNCVPRYARHRHIWLP